MRSLTFIHQREENLLGGHYILLNKLLVIVKSQEHYILQFLSVYQKGKNLFQFLMILYISEGMCGV